MLHQKRCFATSYAVPCHMRQKREKKTKHEKKEMVAFFPFYLNPAYDSITLRACICSAAKVLGC